ncbi:N-6 DNA methylase [Candidatus Protofrankia californiensis]|uniref:N-6 DNA methylase n=1 Tax=Candidatus Protofrankia californiensis TaxID=1839754 RepID=UPI001F493790|nr:N-6 DNA methylase [Candidatus Protofrankia californiensis]
MFVQHMVAVLRAPGSKPAERAGKVLFVNTDAEFHAGRAQNYLLPEHPEKIVSAYREFADIPGYATVVSRAELREQGDNLSIRRYADNAPPPEPQDVRAHLHGWVPRAEGTAKAILFAAHGFSPDALFVDRDVDYLDFASGLAKADLRGLVEEHPGVQDRRVLEGGRTGPARLRDTQEPPRDHRRHPLARPALTNGGSISALSGVLSSIGAIPFRKAGHAERLSGRQRGETLELIATSGGDPALAGRLSARRWAAALVRVVEAVGPGR